MNTQLDYQLAIMRHRRLLAEAEHHRQVHEAPRRPSRLNLLWAAIRQRMGTLRGKNWTETRRSLRETSA